ncbi:MAG TPA: hypothetical protein VGV87_01625 [Blastocatellia bacterium]|jgi:hypothetical protein|nr:hypothetical protein [Blastocatellia bacterium]
MKKTIICIASILIYILAAGINLAQAQEQSKGATVNSRDETSNSQFQLTDLLAQARPQRGRGISLMPVSSSAAANGAAFVITPASVANLPVVGNGTAGRLTKWMGFTSNNSAIGDSSIYEDKFGKIGIGTDSPTSKLTVAGLIESSGAGGGVKFPDGTVQTTSGIAPTDVVKSLNGLKGSLTLAQGTNITITEAGNTLTVGAPNTLTAVVHDQTLTGIGTLASPLSAVQSEALIEPVAADGFVSFIGNNQVKVDLFTVPAGKRLVIEHVSADCEIPTGQRLLNVSITILPFPKVGLQLIPVFVGTYFGADRFLVSQAVRTYGHPGSSVELSGLRNNFPGSGFCDFSFSGFLVNLP